MQGLLAIIAIIILNYCSTITRTLPQNHPNTLLTPHYGILNEDDIQTANWKCTKPVPPYAHEKVYCHGYWLCFPTTMVSLNCDSWPDDQPGQFWGDADIRINTGKELHEYGFRRAFDLRVCKDHLKIWKQITKGTEAICFLGQSAGQEQKTIDGKSVVVKGWVWDRVKTRKGCDSYFTGTCDVSYFRNRGYRRSQESHF